MNTYIHTHLCARVLIMSITPQLVDLTVTKAPQDCLKKDDNLCFEHSVTYLCINQIVLLIFKIKKNGPKLNHCTVLHKF